MLKHAEATALLSVVTMSDTDIKANEFASPLLEGLRKFRFRKKIALLGLPNPSEKIESSNEVENETINGKLGSDLNILKEENVDSTHPMSPEAKYTLKEQSCSLSLSPTNGSNTAEAGSLDSLIKSVKRKADALGPDHVGGTFKPPGARSGKKPKPEVDEEGRTSVENALKRLNDSFPEEDILVLQDTLCRAGWDVEKAKNDLSEKKAKQAVAEIISNDSEKKKMNGSSKSNKKKKRAEVDSCDEDDDTDEDDDGQGYRESKVFDSDADSDEEISDVLTEDKRKVLEFFSKADVMELQQMYSCSKRKAELILDCRPFDGWRDMVEKLSNKNGVGGEILNAAQDLIKTREDAASLIMKCGKLASKMESAVAAGLSNVSCQPSIMSQALKLSDYQIEGLNWLLVMNTLQVNGILADEMGLGKTVQIIAFLSYLKEKKLNLPGKPHLIVVPSSTLENWQNEFERWSPSIKASVYYGSQEERKCQRIQWSKYGFDDTEVLLTTYGMITSCPEERKMFKVIPLHYAIFDEAHMLKNMYTQRFENLIKINAPNRVLVTGTPLQNNLLELMSLLVFVMPKMFKGKQETFKAIFTKASKQPVTEEAICSLPEFERTQIEQAKHIMKPFVLRRLKQDVLKYLPKKTEEIIKCCMTKDQEKKYKDLVAMFSQQANKELQDDQSEPTESGMAMYMKLRRLANHPLLLRYHFKDEILRDMAKKLQSDISYKETVFDYILEDLSILSDFELHTICLNYKSCYRFRLTPDLMGQSGKLMEIDKILPKLKDEGHRVLIFSQFVIVLDVLEEHFKNHGYKFLRLDGSTPVPIRQDLIDEYNRDSSILIFMLSTRAGGLGINLSSADTVIIHDVDPNPHNDKQAEDRCHRIGQSKPVKVIRLVSKGTIEENIFNLAQEKLLLEKEVSSHEENDLSEKKSMARLLKQALGLDKNVSGNAKSLVKPSA